jgi:hypothetical protein
MVVKAHGACRKVRQQDKSRCLAQVSNTEGYRSGPSVRKCLVEEFAECVARAQCGVGHFGVSGLPATRLRLLTLYSAIE